MKASEHAQVRWERAMADAAKYLPTFRLLNNFSVGLGLAWSQLKGSIDFPDLIYAEATRQIDPIAFDAIFSPGAAAHMLLPQTYENQLYAIEVGVRGRDRGVNRSVIFSEIVARAHNRVWIAKVVEEVFGASVNQSGNDQDLVKQVPEPGDDDRINSRLRHPSILFDYYQLTALSQSESNRFVNYFDTLSPESMAVEFALHMRELLIQFRAGKTVKLENIDSDVFLREKDRLLRNPEKAKVLLFALAVLTREIRPTRSIVSREESVIARMMWILLALLPEEITFTQLASVLDQSAMVMLPEIHFPFRFKDEEYRLSEYFLGAMSADRIKRLAERKDMVRKIFADSFALKLERDESFNNFELAPNNNWIFLWFVDISDDKLFAQSKVVAAIKRQFANSNDLFLKNLRAYFYEQSWRGGDEERNNKAQEMFGGEYIWMLERLKKINAI